MVKFRFSIALLCILIPPIVYVASVHFIERYAENNIRTRLEASYLGDTQKLINGTHKLQDAISENVERFLSECQWLKWGGQATVTVQTLKNTLLYPLIHSESSLDPTPSQIPFEVATENFRLISEGPQLFLTFKLSHNTTITNLLLICLIATSMAILFLYYRRWSIHYQRESSQQSEHLEQFTQTESQQRKQLQRLENERTRMSEDIQNMRTELKKQKAASNTNEEEMLDEIISLEEKITGKEELLLNQNEQIDELETKLSQLEILLQKDKNRKQNKIGQAKKRLTTLYKNLDIHDRAVEGYNALTDDLKLKCEEIIVQLNENPSSIPIKRKVFGKKKRTTVLEVVFGYKGRLYFIPKGNKRAVLLTIGTKNSQQQDLSYLERI